MELVFYDQRKPVENGTALAWGELIYDAPLTPEQVSNYELRPSRDNPDVRERMSVQAQAVGAWEKRNRIPEEKCLTFWASDIQALFLSRRPQWNSWPGGLNSLWTSQPLRPAQ